MVFTNILLFAIVLLLIKNEDDWWQTMLLISSLYIGVEIILFIKDYFFM
jgi:hypothetical protein